MNEEFVVVIKEIQFNRSFSIQLVHPSCSISAVQFQLFNPSCSPELFNPAVQSLLFNLSRLIQAVQSQPFNPSCSIPAVHHSCSISAVQSQLFNLSCASQAVQSRLFNPSCSPRLFHPAVQPQLFNHFSCAILAAQSQPFNHSSSISAVKSGSEILAGLNIFVCIFSVFFASNHFVSHTKFSVLLPKTSETKPSFLSLFRFRFAYKIFCFASKRNKTFFLSHYFASFRFEAK